MFPKSIVRSLLACFTALLAGVTACDKDSDCLECPVLETGGITGRITGPEGVPLNAVIEAEGGGSLGGRASAQTDATGRYDLGLSEGSYVLRLRVQDPTCDCAFGYLGGGTLTLRPQEADTFVVGPSAGRVHADVSLGGAAVEVTAPGVWEGVSLSAVLRGRDRSAASFHNHYIAGGRAEIRFPAVTPGSYSVLLFADGDYVSTSGESLAVTAGMETRFETALSPPAVLAGVITGAWRDLGGSPPRVAIFETDSTLILEVGAETRGAFTIRTYATRARLRITIDRVERWYGGDTFAEATVFDLRPGETEFVTVLDSGIAGNIPQVGATDPVSVELVYPDGRRIPYRAFSGSYRFVNLVPGAYYLHVLRASNWIDQWYDGALSMDQATPILIDTEGQVKWANLELEEGAHIRGHVMDRTGQPILGANTVLTTSTSSGRIEERPYSSPEAAFEVGGLVDGQYKLGVRRSGGPISWYPETASWDSAGVIPIVDLADVEGITLRLLE